MEVTYYVALPFVGADDGIAAGEAVECFNPNAVRRWRPHIRIVSSAPSLISYLGLMLFAELSSSTATQRRTFKSFLRNTHKMRRRRFDIGCKDTHPSHIAVRGSCIRRSVHVRIRHRTS
jgi:hypothetical protein